MATGTQNPGLTTPENLPVDWLIWQMADSAFPGGGFTHSGGLEAAFQHGNVKNGADLAAFVERGIFQMAHSQLLFVREAFSENSNFERLDQLLDAYTSNHVINRASRAQGQGFLATIDRSVHSNAIRSLRQLILQNGLPGHFSTVYGATCRILGMEISVTLRLFLFLQMRNWFSSGVRLGIVGPLEAQRLQFNLRPGCEKSLQDCRHKSLDEFAQISPVLELFQGTQDRLYSRLFQS